MTGTRHEAQCEAFYVERVNNAITRHDHALAEELAAAYGARTTPRTSGTARARRRSLSRPLGRSLRPRRRPSR